MNNGAKGGRPKKSQTRPLIFERARSRVTRSLPMSAKTADELEAYVTWAAGMEGADQDEAMLITLDQAIAQFLAKDQLWLEYQRVQSAKPAATRSPADAPKPPATPSAARTTGGA